MPTTLRIKRRASGAAGAPASLLTGELAWNMVDGIVYGGFGDDGSGNATSVKAIAQDDWIANIPSGGTTGQALVKVSNTSGDVAWGTVSSGGTTYTASGDGIELTDTNFSLNYGEIATGLALSTTYQPLDGDLTSIAGLAGTSGLLRKTAANTWSLETTAYAPLASPALTGTPTAPTAATATNTTQIATTAFVQSRINELLAGAGAAYDTFAELQALLEGNEADIGTITTSLSGKLTAANNLSDLVDVSAARGNLGLGTMSTQDADDVAITGGSISGVVLDGGTF